MDLLEFSEFGLYCRAGDFYVDPWRPVQRAVLTHLHSDHACRGCRSYLTSRDGELIARSRLGPAAEIQSAAYGESLWLNGVRVTLHPAGHILGSAQVRVEHRGRVWVVTGDAKLEKDSTCAPFEPIACDTLITESTFGLPVFRWRPQGEVLEGIQDWWSANRAAGRTSILFAYALGKAQRLLTGLSPSRGPVFTHGAVENVNRLYRQAGVELPPTRHVGDTASGDRFAEALVLAPPSANQPGWFRRFPDASRAFVSGWMQIRGHRRRRAVDRGFVLSDHTDWNGLLQIVENSGAENIWVTHGYVFELVRYLNEIGFNARGIETRYRPEPAEAEQ
jgi:putative mRNA 3-end processing factor